MWKFYENIEILEIATVLGTFLQIQRKKFKDVVSIIFSYYFYKICSFYFSFRFFGVHSIHIFPKTGVVSQKCVFYCNFIKVRSQFKPRSVF